MMERTGSQLGNYQLLRRLGRGGAAEVYLGKHIYLNTQAAIKILQASRPEQDMPAFLREARTIAGLVHPNIVRILDFGVQNETFYLVMEYAPRGTLRQNYPEGRRLSLETVVTLVQQIASALQYAHNQNIIHCDVKPENILLGKEQEALLSDFGIALVIQTMSVQAQQIAGTIAYMAPEQFDGKPQKASDQYALAIIAYEWLCGERPFVGSIAEISSQHLRANAAPLNGKVTDLPVAIDEVLRVAMEKDPTRRFSSIQAFARALEQASGRSAGQMSADYDAEYSTVKSTLAPDSTKDRTLQPDPQPAPVLQTPHQSLPATVLSGHLPAIQARTDPQQLSPAPYLPPMYPGQVRREPDFSSMRTTPDRSRRAFLIGATGGAVVVGALVSLAASGRLGSLFSQGSATATPAPAPSSAVTQRASAAQTPTQPATPSQPLGTTLATYSGHSDQVTGVCWSPLPGRTVASSSMDGSVTIWDVTTSTILLTRPQGGQLYVVAWSPDGQFIASAGSDGTVEIWAAASGSLIASCLGHTLSIFGLAWSPDSQRLISVSQDKTAIVWNAADGNHLTTFTGHSDTVWVAAWAANGSAVATGSLDGTVQVWDPDTGAAQVSHTIQSAVRAVDWSPDSSSIACGGDNNVVQVWQVASGNIQATYRGHSNHIEAVQWSHDGQRIASAGQDKTARIWQASNANQIYRYTEHGDTIWSLAWSPDGQLIATGSADRTVRVWQAV